MPTQKFITNDHDKKNAYISLHNDFFLNLEFCKYTALTLSHGDKEKLSYGLVFDSKVVLGQKEHVVLQYPLFLNQCFKSLPSLDVINVIRLILVLSKF